jgi:hypothetical protein
VQLPFPAAAAVQLPMVHLGDLAFQMSTLWPRWCRRCGINFSGHFSVLSWLDPTTVKGINLSPELMSISLGSDRLGSICLLHRWQNEEEERRKKEEKDCARSNLQECWSTFFRHLFSACLLNVCLCGLLFDFFTQVWN